MNTRTDLSKLLKIVDTTPSRDDKIQILRDNNSQQLMHLLAMNWDTDLEWHIPFGDAPEYNSFHGNEADGMLFNQMKTIYVFQKGLHPNQLNMKQAQREKKFIDLLNSISANDARMFWAVRNRTLEQIYPSITHKLVDETFSGLLHRKGKFKEFEKDQRDVVKNSNRSKLVKLQDEFRSAQEVYLPKFENGQTIFDSKPADDVEISDEDVAKFMALHDPNGAIRHKAVSSKEIDKTAPNPVVLSTKAKPKSKESKKT